MMKKILFITSVTVLGLVFGAYRLQMAHAQMLRNMTVVPPTVDRIMNPGETAEGVLKIVNDSAAPLTFTVSVQDFVVEDTKGTPTLLPVATLEKKYSAAAWIGVTPQTVTVKPNERKELNYYIQIPSDARPGGHYAAVVFTPNTVLNVDTTGTAVQTTIGTLFLLRVKGNITEKAEVSSFKTPWFHEYGPIKIQTQIKNFGDLHIRPAGVITLRNMLGMKSAMVKLDEHNVFPGAARDFENMVGKKFMFGRYTATLVATFGVNNQYQLTQRIAFWVIPWRLILVLILLIVAGVLGYKYWKKTKHTTGHETNSEPTTVTNDTTTPETK